MFECKGPTLTDVRALTEKGKGFPASDRKLRSEAVMIRTSCK